MPVITVDDVHEHWNFFKMQVHYSFHFMFTDPMSKGWCTARVKALKKQFKEWEKGRNNLLLRPSVKP